jgi:hypothetical protein
VGSPEFKPQYCQKKKKRVISWDWRCSSVVEGSPSKSKVLGSNPNAAKEKNHFFKVKLGRD